MNTINSIQTTLWAALLLAPSLAFAQERSVDWIHGLGGDQYSWQDVRNGYLNQGRRIIGNAPVGYPTDTRIANFANEVISRNSSGSNKISISHSLGGTAVRQVDIWQPGYWGGNITLGSPLRGARIAVAVRNNDVSNFANHGFTELMRGPRAGGYVTPLVSSFYGISIMGIGNLVNKHSNDIAQALVEILVNTFHLHPDTIDDLDPNGSYMQGIYNQGATNTPKINIWGNEDDPILWRVASSYATGGDDQPGVNAYNDAIGAYETEAGIANTMSWIHFPVWGVHQWRRRCWQAGADWIRDQSNAAWKVLIGSGNSYTQVQGFLELDWQCYEQNQQCDPQNPNFCDQNECWYYEQREVTYFYLDTSDGVVPAYSARNDGGAWRGHIVESPGNNHKQLLMYNQIRNTLDPIFNGTNSGGMQIFQIGL
jgi:hypothetical protein